MRSFTSALAREPWRRRREWAWSNIQGVGSVAALFAAAAAVLTIGLLPAVSHPLVFYVLGAAYLGLLGSWWCLVNAWFLAHQREAVRHRIG